MALFASSPETFFVEEIPAYLPSGEGPHTFLWVEKRGLTTPEAVRRLARALAVPERDLGYAGLKDRHATTRQWISAPGGTPEAALALVVPELRVLEARRHGNKLRTGHLRGNRFEVVLTEVADDEGPILAERFAILLRQGLPNVYGYQRFGAGGDNVGAGLAILRGERRERDHRRRRLLLSAVQSEVFNRALARRANGPGGLLRVRAGDVLQKTASGGLFITEDLATDQARVDAGELVPTGPLPGSRETEPPPDSEAGLLEAEAMAEVGVTRAELAGAGRELPGARRPVLIRVGVPEGEAATESDAGQRSLRLRFSLPAGSYATAVLELLARNPASPEGVAGSPDPKPVLTFRVPGSA
jgi:tRNA pseudouridine13 synthase